MGGAAGRSRLEIAYRFWVAVEEVVAVEEAVLHSRLLFSVALLVAAAAAAVVVEPGR